MRFPVARRAPPVHNARALKKSILFVCALIGGAVFLHGEPAPANREGRALVQSAMADFDAKKYDEAIAKLTDADKKMPDDPFVLNLLGAAYTKKKDFTAAKPYFERSLAKLPGFFPAKFNMGELIFQEGRYPEALDFFRQMLRDSPGNELLQFKIFLCELQIGNKEGAEKALKAIRYPPDTPAWYFAQAVWESKQGNKKKARDYASSARYIFGLKTAMFEELCQDLGFDFR